MSDTKTHKFKLFKSQERVLQSSASVTLLVAGRGVGKSTIACHWILKKIINETHVAGFIGTPSHAQTNDLMTKLVALLDNIGIRYVIGRQPPPSWGSSLTDHKQYLSILLPNKKLCQIRYGSLENFENHRGISIGWLVVDEAALVREIAYREVLLPALRGYGSDYNYQQLLLTTPKGVSNWVSQLMQNSSVNVIRAASIENKIEFNEEKIEQFRSMMSDRQFRQEILGEVLNQSERSQFHAFSITKVKEIDTTNFRFAIASDQNISPLTANIILYSADKVFIHDEIHIEGGATVSDLVAAIGKLNYLKGETVTLYGDRSGNNRSLTSETSFYQQLISRCKDIGISLIDKTLTKNPPIYESRELVNSWLEKDKLFIHPRCKNTINDLEKAQYTEDFKTDKKLFDPHHTDAIAYFFWKEFGKRSEIRSGIFL